MGRRHAEIGRPGRWVVALSAASLFGCAEFRCFSADIRCAKAEKDIEDCKSLESQEYDRCQSRVQAALMACSESRSGCGADDPMPGRFRTRGSGGPAWY